MLDSNDERFASYKKLNPPSVVVAKNENIPVMDSLATGHESRFHSYGIRVAIRIISTGTLLQFLWQEVTRSVATLLGWDASPLQVTPTIVRLPSQIGQYHLHP